MQHKIKVWSVAIDSDAPLSSSVYLDKAAAWHEAASHYTETDEERDKVDAYIAAGDFDGLRDYLSKLIEMSNSIDDYTVDEHELTIDVPPPSDEGVSENPREYGVTVTADVVADSPEEAVVAFNKSLAIGNTDGLTYHVSNLNTGDYCELDS